MNRYLFAILLILALPELGAARSLIRDEGFFTEPKPRPNPSPETIGALTLLGVENAGRVAPHDGTRSASSGGGADCPIGPNPFSGKETAKIRSFLEESRKRPVLVINIPSQDYALYKDGALVKTANCRVGESKHSDFEGTDKCSKTRVGEFKITEWRAKYSNKHYDAWNGDIFTWDMITDQKGAFGAHCAKLNDPAAQWVHGTYGNGVVDDFIINTNILQGSHGCVRFTNDDITALRSLCPIGTKVVRIYATRQDGKEYRNWYEYEDIVDNGTFELSRGELVGYRHPQDARRSK